VGRQDLLEGREFVQPTWLEMALMFPLPDGIMCRLFGRLMQVFNERSCKARENHATSGMIAAK
jgi:hypothetical protein